MDQEYRNELSALIRRANWLIAKTQAGAVRVKLETAHDQLTQVEDRLAKMTDQELLEIIA